MRGDGIEERGEQGTKTLPGQVTQSPKGPKGNVSKMAWLHGDQRSCGKGKRSPVPALEKFRVGAGICEPGSPITSRDWGMLGEHGGQCQL